MEEVPWFIYVGYFFVFVEGGAGRAGGRWVQYIGEYA